jgi:hypothetical protein
MAYNISIFRGGGDSSLSNTCFELDIISGICLLLFFTAHNNCTEIPHIMQFVVVKKQVRHKLKMGLPRFKAPLGIKPARPLITYNYNIKNYQRDNYTIICWAVLKLFNSYLAPLENSPTGT